MNRILSRCVGTALFAGLLSGGIWLRTARAGDEAKGSAGATAAPAEAMVKPLELKEAKLSNGLRVIIGVDHTAPVYAIDVCYNVGSRNERPGRTGFAHLFEHMMFEGSQNVGKGEHFILVLNNGGGMNGTTNEDRTTYFEILPKNQLDLGLYLEADRMKSLNITQSNLDNQRNAVQEERRLSIDNEPYGKSELDLDNLAFDNFAYKHSTIGSMTDLNSADIKDVQDFFRTYYAPNNAVLTLVGDLDPDTALAQVKKYFEAIPEQPEAAKMNLSEEEHYGERSETIHDQLARLPAISMAYHVDRGDTEGNRAAHLLAVILGQGHSSRLYQDLVKDKQLAIEANAMADTRIGPSLLYITVVARPGVKLEDLEKALDADIEKIAKDGITDQELTKAKAQERTQWIEARSSDLRTAVAIGDYAVKFNDPNLINHLGQDYASMTKDQVNEVAKKDLTKDQRAVVITLPGKGGQAEEAQGGAQ
jgi:zinc protease